MLSVRADLNQQRRVEENSTVSCSVKKKQYLALHQQVRTLGVTINTVIQFAWHKLIQIYTQDDSTIVGMT